MRLHFVYSHGHDGRGRDGPLRLLILTVIAARQVPVSRRTRKKRC
jgi:hypothetical protein